MKNPLEDPDQPTLSAIRKSSDLKSAMNSLESLAGTFQSVLLRVQNLEATRRTLRSTGGKRHLRGGSDPKPTEFAANLKADRARFKDFYDDDDRNTFATPAPSRVRPEEPNFDDRKTPVSARSPFYERTDLLTPDTPPVSGVDDRSWTSMIFYLIQLLRQMDILVNSSLKPNIASLSQAQGTRLTEIYEMINSSYDELIAPLQRRTKIFSKGPSTKIGKDPFSKVKRFQTDIPYVMASVGTALTNVDEDIIRENEYGDEILNTFNTERRKLLLDLTVVINSWKQNSPTGQATELTEELEEQFVNIAKQNELLYKDAAGLDTVAEGVAPQNVTEEDADKTGSGRRRKMKKTGSSTLVGCGRNFYGEKINDSRDIPTIRISYRDCPTKYLL
jgi:hypothetical protein